MGKSSVLLDTSLFRHSAIYSYLREDTGPREQLNFLQPLLPVENFYIAAILCLVPCVHAADWCRCSTVIFYVHFIARFFSLSLLGFQHLLNSLTCKDHCRSPCELPVWGKNFFLSRCLFKLYFVKTIFHDGGTVLKRKSTAFCGCHFHTRDGKFFIIRKFLP